MKLDNGILTESHLWHYILPTWLAQTKSKFIKKDQENYIKHLNSMGYQPAKIKIESELEVNVFLRTIAICFNTNIEFNIQNPIGEVIQKIWNPCATQMTIYLSKRVTIDSLPCMEMWMPITWLEQYTGEAVTVLHIISNQS